MITTTGHIKLVDRQLERLGLDTNWHPYSGISTEAVQSDVFLIRIFNDYASGIYHAESVAETLSGHESLSIEEFWDVIYDHETIED